MKDGSSVFIMRGIHGCPSGNDVGAARRVLVGALIGALLSTCGVLGPGNSLAIMSGGLIMGLV